MEDICRNIKLAKEYTILNNYETTVVLMTNMASQIERCVIFVDEGLRGFAVCGERYEGK